VCRVCACLISEFLAALSSWCIRGFVANGFVKQKMNVGSVRYSIGFDLPAYGDLSN